jgi:hypothetical protein
MNPISIGTTVPGINAIQIPKDSTSAQMDTSRNPAGRRPNPGSRIHLKPPAGRKMHPLPKKNI